ncbi:MAG: GtrA family protein [Actinomycetota bacterium]|nr:GtrA family protein [Actinomycetota bacterium]
MSGLLSFINEFRTDGKYVKAFRYVVTSGVSVVVAQVTLFILFGVARKFSATSSNVIATGVSAVPAYYMNRNWAWGKSGKSHFWKEVFPFWALAFLGLAVSIVTVAFADRYSKSHNFTHLGAALAVNFASLFAFGILWVGKFFIFNKFMFSTSDVNELEAA